MRSDKGNVRTVRERRLGDRESQRSLGIHRFEAPSGELAAATIHLIDAFPELHEHSDAQVSFLLHGASAEFVTRSFAGSVIRTPFHPGTVVYISPGQPHRVQWQGKGEMLNFYFRESFLRDIAEQTESELPHRSLQSADSGVRAIGQLIMDEFSWTDRVSNSVLDHARFLVAARLLRLFGLRSRRSAVGVLDLKRLQPALDAIIASPEKHFDLADLARLCNSSPFHFARSFKARVGDAPYAYQRELRLQKAKSLLRETNLSIEAVAYAVGTETATNFSRMFRQCTGHSPKAFRQLANVPCESFRP